MGSVYKAFAFYERPFWRDRDFRDLLVLDRPGRAVFDTSPPNGPGHLCIIVPGPEGRALTDPSPDARKAALPASMTALIGTRALSPVGWHEKF